MPELFSCDIPDLQSELSNKYKIIDHKKWEERSKQLPSVSSFPLSVWDRSYRNPHPSIRLPSTSTAFEVTI